MDCSKMRLKSDFFKLGHCHIDGRPVHLTRMHNMIGYPFGKRPFICVKVTHVLSDIIHS